MGTPRVAIILRYGLNPTAWRKRHDAGELVDETPYAYHLADEWFTTAWSTDHKEGRMSRMLRMTVRRVMGFDLVHVWRNRRIIQAADAVWTHTEREHLAVAFLKALQPSRYRAVTVAQSVWLWDQWGSISGVRRRLFRSLLRRHEVEVVLSSDNRDLSRSSVPGRTVIRVPFGTHFARARGANAALPVPPRVLTIGNDRHRDWPLLLEVSKRMPEVDFDVISLSEDAQTQPWPANVVVRSTTQLDILENAYAEATVVAIPLIRNHHASGCTVAIEAISAGLPVVASEAGGIQEYLEGGATQLVAVGDAAGFEAAIRSAIAAPPQAEPGVAEARGLSESDYVTRLASLTLSLLERAPIVPAVETFTHLTEPPTKQAASPASTDEANIPA